LTVLTRYIIREYLKILALGAATFVLIFFVVELFERINVVIVHKAPLYVLLEYFIYALPPFFSQTLPFAVLLSTLITLGIRARNNEIVAMQAHGIGTYRIISPLFVLAIMATAFLFVCNETVVPYAVRKADYIWTVKVKKEKKRAFFRLNKIWYHGDEAIYNIRLLEPKDNALRGVTIYQFDKDFNVRRRMDAREARWKRDRWFFSQVVIRDFSPGGEVSTTVHEKREIVLAESLEDFKKGVKHPEEMSYRELKEYVAKIKGEGYNYSRYLVDLHVKVAFPFVNLIMVLIGSPLALLTGRRRGGGIAQGVGLSLVVGFIYWVAFSLTLSMGHAGILPPLIAAWTPNVFFGLVGGAMLESIHQ